MKLVAVQTAIGSFLLGGSGGMLPRKILKIRVLQNASET